MCGCTCVSLTENCDVDAGGGALVLHALADVADVVAAAGCGDIGEDEAGAHVHGRQDVCQRLHRHILEQRVTHADRLSTTYQHVLATSS